MRFAILCSPGSWYFNDLLRAAGSRHEIIPLSFEEIRSQLGPRSDVSFQSGAIDLSQFDALLVRTMPPGTLEQVVFRMDLLNCFEASGGVVVNPARAVEVAVDKYLALVKLQAAGLLIPRTQVCQTFDQAMLAFEQLGGDVVIKPLFGSEGRGIMRVSDESMALRVFKALQQLGSVIYLQEFIEHEGFDLRLFVVGKRLLGMRRQNQSDWRTNVSRGATTHPIEVDASLAEKAFCAAEAIGAPIAGVDFLPSKDGNLYVLEVNAVPGWKALSATLGVDVAELVIDYLASVASRPDRS